MSADDRRATLDSYRTQRGLTAAPAALSPADVERAIEDLLTEPERIAHRVRAALRLQSLDGGREYLDGLSPSQLLEALDGMSDV